ncbi:MAG: hypothetical protein HY074_05465 [Deltaproteobacteria bacterium]|nr:hypothetical protein [Deltaproteobacteria bacterium]
MSNKIRGKQFMFTGTFRYRGIRITRDRIIAVIEQNGGRFVQNENARGIAAGTDFLILGEWNARVKDIDKSKLSDAQAKKIPVLTPEQFLDLLSPEDRNTLLAQRDPLAA